MIRLGVPILASSAFAAALYAIFHGANINAGPLVGSTWLSDGWRPETSTWFAADAVLNGLFVGYRDVSPVIWAGVPNANLPSIFTAYNSPLWTMPMEFYGSIFIFLMIRLSRIQSNWKILIYTLLFLVFHRTPFLCFLIGHMAARFELAERAVMTPRWLAGFAVIVGLFLANRSDFWTADIFKRYCEIHVGPMLPCLVHPMFFQKQIAAIIITIGLMQLMSARRLLAHSRFKFVGTISFPIYLVHMPIICGVSSSLVVLIAPKFGVASAEIAAMAVGIPLAVLVARIFIRVDRAAIAWSQYFAGRR